MVSDYACQDIDLHPPEAQNNRKYLLFSTTSCSFNTSAEEIPGAVESLAEEIDPPAVATGAEIPGAEEMIAEEAVVAWDAMAAEEKPARPSRTGRP